MNAIKFYFEIEKKNFSVETALALINSFFDRYHVKPGKEVEKDAVAAAKVLYRGGVGGGFDINALLLNCSKGRSKLPYDGLNVGAFSKENEDFASFPIPKGKVYFCMSTDSTNLGNEKALESFVEDAVLMYYALRPAYGIGDSEDAFSYAQVPSWAGKLFSATFFGPARVSEIGIGNFLKIQSEVYQLRRLNDGGILLWLRKGDPEDNTPILPAPPPIENKIFTQLGLKPRF